MFHYLLSVIPRLLFEPVAVTAAVSCILAFLAYRKKHERFYWIIVFAIAFMLFWRLAIHPLMVSSRYTSILLYPAIIFTTWLCFQLKTYLGRSPKRKRFLPKKFILWFPILAVAGLSIACLIKTLHYNPYDDHIVKICKALKADGVKRNFLVVSACEHNRIAYYAGIPRNKVLEWDGDCKTLKKTLKWHRNYFETLYFVFYLNKNEQAPDAQFLNLKPEIGQWKFIHLEYTSRRKNKEIVLYRFKPADPNIEVWNKPIPAMSQENKCPNGDFEQYITGNELKERIAYYSRIKSSVFYTQQNNLFPTHWWLGVGFATKGKFPTMALTADQPIVGKYSLEMNGLGIGWSGMNCDGFNKQDGFFSGFIRARKDSFLQIFSCYWSSVKKDTAYMDCVKFNATAGKTYRFSMPVRQADVPKQDSAIYIIIQTPGHILVDNVEFIPTKK